MKGGNASLIPERRELHPSRGAHDCWSFFSSTTTKVFEELIKECEHSLSRRLAMTALQ